MERAPGEVLLGPSYPAAEHVHTDPPLGNTETAAGELVGSGADESVAGHRKVHRPTEIPYPALLVAAAVAA